MVFSIQDITAIAQLAQRHDIRTMIDNTWSTPLYQKPLQLGIDLEMHSCSKYLGGHSDIVSGVLIGAKSLIESIHAREYELLGAKMAPIEASYLLRSLRTLTLRMERHQDNAMKVAAYLQCHNKVAKVYYPGLVSHPNHLLASQQMDGYSGLLSFELACRDKEQVKAFVNALELFQIGVSWGGHESLVYAPAISYAKEQTPEQLEKMTISIANIRLSVGLEDIEDLLADLEGAFNCI